ncbi:hypothetical protein [Oryza sativa Japonica Group]|uniref:Uncharacterized protein P0702H08.14 n=1 Tax=Oryza sativa subsp. japonica TaxID=39947 RepID=Q5JM28_ORYSJ|nr:hypothetical protein [Oryza sativa Japonica Group]
MRSASTCSLTVPRAPTASQPTLSRASTTVSRTRHQRLLILEGDGGVERLLDLLDAADTGLDAHAALEHENNVGREEGGEAAVRGSIEDAELDLDLHHGGGEDRGG